MLFYAAVNYISVKCRLHVNNQWSILSVPDKLEIVCHHIKMAMSAGHALNIGLLVRTRFFASCHETAVLSLDVSFIIAHSPNLNNGMYLRQTQTH